MKNRYYSVFLMIFVLFSTLRVKALDIFSWPVLGTLGAASYYMAQRIDTYVNKRYLAIDKQKEELEKLQAEKLADRERQIQEAKEIHKEHAAQAIESILMNQLDGPNYGLQIKQLEEKKEGLECLTYSFTAAWRLALLGAVIKAGSYCVSNMPSEVGSALKTSFLFLGAAYWAFAPRQIDFIKTSRLKQQRSEDLKKDINNFFFSLEQKTGFRKSESIFESKASTKSNLRYTLERCMYRLLKYGPIAGLTAYKLFS